VSSKPAAALFFFLAFLALLIAIHLPYLQLPFFWDEVGQFIPAALDLYHDGEWVPHSTLPNVHPPGLMAVLALIWRVFGFSIAATRLTMLAIASVGLMFSFLLAIRLSRGAPGAPAFAAAMFLIAAPIFYTQAMLAQLDMPAMALTALALWLFLEERYAASAVACVASVLMKETTVTTPLVFAAWLWFREQRRSEAVYFLAPAVALGAWLVILNRMTGHVFGNGEFTNYNVIESLNPVHFVLSLGRRIYFLFIGNGHFIGALAIFVGWRMLRGKEWTIAALVSGAQVLLVTVLGGAMLDRYVLPVLPIVYAAMAVGASAYPASWRWNRDARRAPNGVVLESSVSVPIRKQSGYDRLRPLTAGRRWISGSLGAGQNRRQRVASHRRAAAARVRLCSPPFAGGAVRGFPPWEAGKS
jgi:4-amino-4-deoxy-L-arabinose transferase-like glycosyltransferase